MSGGPFVLTQGWWDGGLFLQPIARVRGDGVGEATGLAARDGGGLDGLTVIARRAAIESALDTDALRVLPYVVDLATRRPS